VATSLAIPALLAHCFSASYAQARERFLAAASAAGAQLQSFGLEVVGAQGESLATDVALIRPVNARSVLIVSSATHGVEGFCGSACQQALLADAELLARAARTGVALLLVHAVNPYGFSWISRTNEDNIDLNRNAQDFTAALPNNPDYAPLHPLLVPPAWPPDHANRHAIADHIARNGGMHYRDAVSKGQYTHPAGLFFGGSQRSASLHTLEHVLRTQAGEFTDIGWIDIHTGLGPCGHGEKIFAGRRDAEEVARAKQWWGGDIAVPFAGTSTSADITGHLASTIYHACPDARRTLMALEFGTVPFEEMVDALRGEAWLRQHPEAPPALAQRIRGTLRDAFYCDTPAWQGMVLGQSRLAILQALLGLASGHG
jgi:hypothetical protein